MAEVDDKSGASSNDANGFCAKLAQTCVQSSKSAYGVDLDFSITSLEALDSVLHEMHEEHKSKPIGDQGLSIRCLALGAYIGEVLRREIGRGHWEKDSSYGENTFPLVFSNDQSVFPLSWARKRILNGPEDNVAFKAKVWISAAQGNSLFAKK